MDAFSQDEPMDMADSKDLAEIAKNATQALAVVVGGIWAYFKFFRGRTFARRAELNLKGTLYKFKDELYVRVIITLRNAGASKIPLEKDIAAVYLYGVQSKGYSPGSNLDWQEHLVLTPILESHKWIEPHETVTDEVLIPVPHPSGEDDGNWLAFRLHAKVWGKKRALRRKGTRWAADATVPAYIEVVHSEEIRNDKQAQPGSSEEPLGDKQARLPISSDEGSNDKQALPVTPLQGGSLAVESDPTIDPR
jgi:hypothetical protein